MAARLAVKSASETLSAVVAPSPRRATEGALVATSSTLSSSPTGSTDTMVSRMRAVLKRHQCGSEEEAVTVCMRQAAQAASKPSALAVANGQCSSYINSLRYCQLQTQQHNYPVALGGFMY